MTDTPLVYLNNAATTWPKPQCVTDAVTESLKLPAFGTGRTAGTEGHDYPAEAREKLANLLHADTANICFTHNATDALNILISGYIAGHRNCHVLTTELDHNSVLRPLHELQIRNQCTYTAVPFCTETNTVTPENLEKAVTRDTKLAVISHASNVLGSVENIRDLIRILHEHEIFVIVDGSQSAGHIPINMKTLDCDAFAVTGHKALFGIPGTGAFWIRTPESIKPTRFGGTGTDSRNLKHPKTMPERFETGTQNFVGCAALSAGISYIQSRGIPAIHDQGNRQSKRILHVLENLDGISIHSKSPEIPIISFTVSDISPDDFGFILARKYRILTRTGLHCAPLVHQRLNIPDGSIRVSLSAMTTDTDCDAFCTAVTEICG